MHPSSANQGLRSRKLARTRAALIDAAVDLVLSRGYEHTTVEAIAARVDVSPRTFSRYFASKDAVFVAVLDDLADMVAAELTTLPPELGPLEAMRVALGSVFTRAHPFSAFSPERLARIIKVVTASAPLRQAAIEYRGAQVVAALGARMNVGTDDPRLALVMSLISVTVVHSWTTLATADLVLDPSLISKHVDEGFRDLACYAADLHTVDVGR